MFWILWFSSVNLQCAIPVLSTHLLSNGLIPSCSLLNTSGSWSPKEVSPGILSPNVYAGDQHPVCHGQTLHVSLWNAMQCLDPIKWCWREMLRRCVGEKGAWRAERERFKSVSNGSEFHLDWWAPADSLVDLPVGCCSIKAQACPASDGKAGNSLNPVKDWDIENFCLCLIRSSTALVAWNIQTKDVFKPFL